MRKETLHYSFREYDSRITQDTVLRCYFGVGQSHQISTQRLKNQITEMLGWFCEHMVLPTDESRALANWLLEEDRKYPTKTTVPKTWTITDPKQTWTNPKTGYVKHTRPSAIGVLGGMVMNSLTQREFTEPQIVALRHFFAQIASIDEAYPGLFPQHWICYEFEHQETAQRDTQDRLTELFR